MLTLFKNLKLKYKVLLPNILYLVLLGTALFFFLNSNSLIKGLETAHKASNVLSDKIRKTALDTKGYIHEEMAYATLEKDYQGLFADTQSRDLSVDFREIWTEVGKIRDLRQANKEMEERVTALTNTSIENSNTYIDQAVKRLADERDREGVSKLERLVVQGANVNTSTSYQVQVLFGELQKDLQAGERLLPFLETLIQNTQKDLERLEGTAFKKLPEAALKANLEIKEIALAYINRNS